MGYTVDPFCVSVPIIVLTLLPRNGNKPFQTFVEESRVDVKIASALIFSSGLVSAGSISPSSFEMAAFRSCRIFVCHYNAIYVSIMKK